MNQDLEEPRLVSRAIKGDVEAFGDLYERNLRPIYRYVYYRVGSHHDAEDLTEQVFLKAWENLAGYRMTQAPFRAWLYRIAHNMIIDHHRVKKEVIPLGRIESMAGPAPDPENAMIFREQGEHLARMIARLSEIHQHVLVLRFIEGMDVKEVSSILNKSEGAIRVIQHRALKELYGLMTVEEVANV